MPSLLAPMRRLRASVTTPGDHEVDPEYRGFYGWAEGPSIVPPVGRTFLQGYRIGMEEPGAVHVMRALQRLPREWQGFAAEGAGMSVAIRAAVEPWHRNEFHKLVSVSGGRHTYMMHVGLGWALARLPRPLWPDLSQFDPSVAPLILDGYGFHEVFFNTTQTLGQRGATDFPMSSWPGTPDDARHQVMQGVGRGMWFVAGGSPAVLESFIDSFDAEISGSLWAGVGLAATYAGGRDSATLTELIQVAGSDVGWLRQGCAFAAQARHRANTVNDHTVLATRTLCGREVADLAALSISYQPNAQVVDSGDWSAYEQWRARIADHFSSDSAQAPQDKAA